MDLWDHDAFQRQEHHEMLALLRETDPGIHWIDEGDLGPGYWAITRQAHLKEVNRTVDIFSSNAGRHPDDTSPTSTTRSTQAMNQGLHDRARRAQATPAFGASCRGGSRPG